MGCGNWINTLTRHKFLCADDFPTPLDHYLTTFDLNILGLAQMIGAGIFLITGTVANTTANPTIVLSFFVAGILAVLSALYYAKFGLLIPCTKPAYLFIYTILGEGLGFLVGWCVLSELIIGSATLARAFSWAIDSLLGEYIWNITVNVLGLNEIPEFSDFPKFLVILLIVTTSGVAIWGNKITSHMNNALIVIQLFGIIFIIFIGFLFGDIDNWINESKGVFFQYDITGAISGAATCYFAFVGFDSIALAEEEAKRTKQSLLYYLLIALQIVCVLYLLTASALTLFQSFYKSDILTPFPFAFKAIGVIWAKYIVAVGALVALFTTLTSIAYALLWLIYAISSGDLILEWLWSVNHHTRTPVNAISIASVFVILVAIFLDVKVLVELYSVGTLLGLTFVATSLIKLHYQLPKGSLILRKYLEINTTGNVSELILPEHRSKYAHGQLRGFALQLPIIPRVASVLTVNRTRFGMLTCQFMFGICLTLGFRGVGFEHRAIWVMLIVLGVLAFLLFVLLALYKSNDFDTGCGVMLPLIIRLTVGATNREPICNDLSGPIL